MSEVSIEGVNKGLLQELKKEDKILSATETLQAKLAATRATAAQNLAVKAIPVAANKIFTMEEINENTLSIPNLLDTKDDEYEHCCLYGDAGMGKTLAICLLAEFFPVLFLDGDKGLKTAIRTLPPEMQRNIYPIRVPDNTSNPVFWNSVLKIITGRQVTICVGHGLVDCPICKQSGGQLVTTALNKLPKNWVVGMDSVTQFVASAMAMINRKATGASGTKDTNDEFKFTFDEWAILRNITEKFGNYLKDLECNFFAASHTLLTKTEDEKTQKIVPIGGTENASRSFAKYFSTVINCKVVNGKHVFATSSTYNAGATTKSRSNVRLELEEIPSLLHILRPDAKEILKGSWNEWYFTEGVKPEKDRKKLAPKPKGLLPI